MAIQTQQVRQMIDEAMAVAMFLDGKDVHETVTWDGQETTPAMLLSLAINRLRRAGEELDTARLTYFGFAGVR